MLRTLKNDQEAATVRIFAENDTRDELSAILGALSQAGEELAKEAGRAIRVDVYVTLLFEAAAPPAKMGILAKRASDKYEFDRAAGNVEEISSLQLRVSTSTEGFAREVANGVFENWSGKFGWIDEEYGFVVRHMVMDVEADWSLIFSVSDYLRKIPEARIDDWDSKKIPLWMKGADSDFMKALELEDQLFFVLSNDSDTLINLYWLSLDQGVKGGSAFSAIVQQRGWWMGKRPERSEPFVETFSALFPKLAKMLPPSNVCTPIRFSSPLFPSLLVEMDIHGFMRLASEEFYAGIRQNVQFRFPDDWKTVLSILFCLSRAARDDTETLRSIYAAFKSEHPEEFHREMKKAQCFLKAPIPSVEVFEFASAEELIDLPVSMAEQIWKVLITAGCASERPITSVSRFNRISVVVIEACGECMLFPSQGSPAFETLKKLSTIEREEKPKLGAPQLLPIDANILTNLGRGRYILKNFDDPKWDFLYSVGLRVPFRDQSVSEDTARILGTAYADTGAYFQWALSACAKVATASEPSETLSAS